MRRLLPAAVLLLAACAREAPPVVADPACFGTRVLAYGELVAEVLIPSAETCASGTFQVVFVRGADTLQTLTESRTGSVGFIGTADLDGDGRGEFLVATHSEDSTRTGMLFVYTDGAAGIARFPLPELAADQREGYAGQDRFGLVGTDRLVRAYPRGTAGDSAWFAFVPAEAKWTSITRPDWVR